MLFYAFAGVELNIYQQGIRIILFFEGNNPASPVRDTGRGSFITRKRPLTTLLPSPKARISSQSSRSRIVP